MYNCEHPPKVPKQEAKTDQIPKGLKTKIRKLLAGDRKCQAEKETVSPNTEDVCPGKPFL